MRFGPAAFSIAFVIAFGSACAWMNPLVVTPEARRTAKVALTAYETTQEAMLIYGHLPGCDAEAGVKYLCRDAAAWNKIKIADKLATRAINDAAPVLNGSAPDGGEIVKALIAIDQVKLALRDAQTKLTIPPAKVEVTP